MKKLTARVVAALKLLSLEALLLGGVFLASFALFFYLVRVVFGAPTVAFDTWAFAQMDALRRAVPGLTAVMQAVTFFASLPFLVVAALVLPWWLRRRGAARAALAVFLAVAGAALLNQLLKTYFHRLRPSSALVQQLGLSFPSGHAMIGLSLYGCLAWLVWRRGHHPAWAAALVGWALLIGLTRVYLHVHYATDVLAGFAGAVLWLGLLRAGLKMFRPETVRGEK
ncbi:phosphatase PAP2 family protein [Hymenobacter weizhouensis]|uniref:phosphatase PAP2 family protein n=1 Tax=Hymenobacter sp. YIM 151500-1 TaxID=2987689 RepID=UPI002227100F|nr:phosphatase PAP2 family protein [Hymenobacter sp. YIM 151500-1]UYZ65044.1 phosphatase PAP2 family protein [Hymenobacter sp. YIM 151500-1]